MSAAKVQEMDAILSQKEAAQYPKIILGGFAAYNSNPIDESIHTGDFDYLLSGYGGASGPLSALSPLPAEDISLAQGSDWPYAVHGTVVQPLSMLPQIKTGIRAAGLEKDIANSELNSFRNRISYDVQKCYCGILVTEVKIQAAEAEITHIKSQLHHVADAVEVGETLALNLSGLQVELTEAQVKLEEQLASQKRFHFLLNLLVGNPIEQTISIAKDFPREPTRRTIAEYLQLAKNQNPDIAKAAQQLALAEQGLTAVDQSNYPDLFAFGTVIHQEGTPLIQDTFALAGLAVSWELYDFGKTDADRAASRQKKVQARELKINSMRSLEKDIITRVSELDHADAMILLAEKAQNYRKQEMKLVGDQVELHLKLDTRMLQSRSDLAHAKSDLLAARVNRLLILLQLDHLSGLSRHE
jgi:outer membrane protein TolC